MKETKFKQTLVQTKEGSRHCEERSDVAIQSGFKMTEVGMIPSDWGVACLGDLGSFKNGISKPAEKFGHGFPFVNLMDIFEKTSIKGNEEFGLIESVSSEQQMYSLRRGDVLFVRSSVKPEGVGLTTVVKKDLSKTVFSGFILRFRELGERLNTDYKEFVFYSDYFRRNLIASSTVSANTNINQPALKKLIIAFPKSIEEQQRIANALSDVDTLINNLEKLIAKKKNIKLGAMQQLLTGKKRLPGFAGKWSDFVLGQSGFLLKNSINPQFSATKYFSEYSMPAYDEIQKPERVLGCSMHSNRTQISGEVLLFNKLNVRQKRVWYVRKCAENAVCSMEFLPYCSQKIDLQLLRQILLTDEVTFDFIGMSTGTSNSQKRIAPKNFLDYSLRLPQDIREQKAIAEILVDMDSEIQALNKKIIQYRKLKTGMMQQLLTGKIRLV